MNISKHIELVERRITYGKNIGALDFLIELGQKRFFMQAPEQAYNTTISNSGKYKKIEALNSGLSKNTRKNEFGYLIEYAVLLRSVQMTQTYIGVVRYLITKIKLLDESQKSKLLSHIRSAYLVSGDESLLCFLKETDESSLRKISLPRAIIESMPESYGNLLKVGGGVQDEIFSYQSDLFQIKRILKDHGHVLSAEQQHGLSINKAALLSSNSSYLDAINMLFSSAGLRPLVDISLDTANVLGTIRVDDVKESVEDRGLVSIVMSCYNSEATVGYALQSLLKQTYSNIEILVCDDNSSDTSLEIISEISNKDPRIKLFKSRQNQGTYNIRNALIEEAKGDFITFQDSDDWSHPQRIEKQVNFLIDNKVAVCSSRWVRIAPDGHAKFFVDGRILRFCVVSTIVRRSAFSVVPKFRQSLVAADTEFHEACIKFFGEKHVCIIEHPLILGLWGDGSLTKKEGLQAENNGQVALKRREYSEIAARQRILGSSIISDEDVTNILKKNGIYREYMGVELMEVEQ